MELALLGLSLACWIVALASHVGLLPTAGILNLGLYQFYGVAAFVGWLAGNVYVQRTRGFARPLRRRVLLIYLFGPPGFLYLLRSLAAATEQTLAPLAPVFASGIFVVFFLVPVTLKGKPGRQAR